MDKDMHFSTERPLSPTMHAFRESFSTCGGSYRETCHCGVKFYNDDEGWDWREGELDRLRRDEHAVSLEYSVPSLEFNGHRYCWDCDCWHEAAAKVITFLDSHLVGINAFFERRVRLYAERADELRQMAGAGRALRDAEQGVDCENEMSRLLSGGEVRK